MVRKQQVIDNFVGDSLNERWNEHNAQGTGTFAMVDAINEGFSVICGGGLNDSSQINFNDINQFDPASVQCIVEARSIQDTLQEFDFGLRNGLAGHFIIFSQKTNSSTFIRMSVNDGSGTINDTSVSNDTVWHNFIFILKTSLARFYIDGIFEGVITTNLPTQKLQPRFRVGNDTAAAREGRTRYYEAYNT